MDNDILAYYQAITDGSVCVGHWIEAWYKQIVSGIQSGEYIFSQKKASVAIRFIEGFCRHHEGALAPQHIRLELWQRALVSVIFGVLDKNGLRQFREVFVVMGRKNGKTLLAAAISCYMAYLDGEYGGRIYYAAPKLDQARLCYEAFYQMIQKEPVLRDRTKRRRSDIYIAESNTTAQPLAFSAKTSDGLNISLCVADELASWSGDKGLKYYEVLKSSFGARSQPLLFSISTAGYVNDGIYDELIKRSTAVLNGTSSETRLAPFLYMIDDVDRWNDLNELRKSNPNLGVSVSYDYLLEEIAVAEGSLSKKSEFLTKYCNIKQSSSSAWFDYQDIEKCLSEPLLLEDFRNSYAVCGIDLSQTTDLTSACVVIERGGILNVISHFWMPAERLEEATAEDGVPYAILKEKGFLSFSGENRVDYKDVFEWARRLVDDYKIYPLRVGYDQYCAQYLVDDLREYGFHCESVRQGFNLTPVIQELEGLIKDGNMRIGDNSLLQAHLLNSALKRDNEINKVRLVKITGRARIDGCAALLDAICVRQQHFAEIGGQLQN